MCVIVDANQAHRFKDVGKLPYLAAVVRWVNAGGFVVSGGKLETELFKVGQMRGLLTEWERAGRIKRVAPAKLDAEMAVVEPLCRSDDPHVIALARLSGADLVVTEDQNLMHDLRDLTLVGKRRRIYKEAINGPAHTRHHADMLRKSGCKA